MNQLDLFQGRKNRDQGIKQAEDHANQYENWSVKAYTFLLYYIQQKKEFMTEEMREASKGSVPDPPSARAWGGIIVRAVKNGLIKRKGYGQVKNPKAHRANASVWETV